MSTDEASELKLLKVREAIARVLNQPQSCIDALDDATIVFDDCVF